MSDIKNIMDFSEMIGRTIKHVEESGDELYIVFTDSSLAKIDVIYGYDGCDSSLGLTECYLNHELLEFPDLCGALLSVDQIKTIRKQKQEIEDGCAKLEEERERRLYLELQKKFEKWKSED